MLTQFFYLESNGTLQGPVALERLQDLLDRGNLTKSDKILFDGQLEWNPISSILQQSSVNALSANLPPPAPVDLPVELPPPPPTVDLPIELPPPSPPVGLDTSGVASVKIMCERINGLWKIAKWSEE
jgi:hypothetical protein